MHSFARWAFAPKTVVPVYDMIRTQEICFRIGDFQLQSISVHVERGEYFVLMGPPGSGKSILLECICGLRRIQSGRVLIDGRDVTRLEPRERDIGYVPQSYALFEHLSVEDNIGFGLKRRGMSRGAIRRKIQDVAELLGIGNLLTRSVPGLSGGEQQRVALARAVVIEPKLLLLDEPVSALDDATRRSVCSELTLLQRRLGITTVHVSHNREEAFSVGQRGAILRAGSLQQAGSLRELLREPRNEFVAGFMCCENLFEGEAIGAAKNSEGTRISIAGVEFVARARFEGRAKFAVRPEDVKLSRTPESGQEEHTQVLCKLVRTMDYGAYVRTELEGPIRLVSDLPHVDFNELRADIGDDLVCIINSSAIHMLPT